MLFGWLKTRPTQAGATIVAAAKSHAKASGRVGEVIRDARGNREHGSLRAALGARQVADPNRRPFDPWSKRQ